MNHVAEANAQLDQIEATGFPVYMKLLFDEFQDPSKTENSRNIALVLLTRCLTSPSPSRRKQQAQRWLETFNEDARNVMKGALINTLQTASRGIARSAARVASLIAVIEIPCGQWNDFFPIMEQNLGQQTNLNAYHAFLTCLGYTCQDLDKSMQIEDPSVILRSVCPFIDPERGLELNEVAINALNNSIEFCRADFALEKDRGFLIGVMINSCDSKSTFVRSQAYQCLTKTFGLFYPLLDTNNFTLLFNMIMTHLPHETDELITSILEILHQLAEVENIIKTTNSYPPKTLRYSLSLQQLSQYQSGNAMLLNACKQIYMPIFPLLCLILQSKPDDYDNPDWDKFHSASLLLNNLVRVIGDEAAESVMNYVNANINSTTGPLRDAALQALGCIFNGTTRSLVFQVIDSHFMSILGVLRSDPSSIIRDTAAHLVNKISTDLPEIVGKHFLAFVEIIKEGLHPNNSLFIRRQMGSTLQHIMRGGSAGAIPSTWIVEHFSILFELILQNMLQAPNQMFLDSMLDTAHRLIVSMPIQQFELLGKTMTSLMQLIEGNATQLEQHILMALLTTVTYFQLNLRQQFNTIAPKYSTVLLTMCNTSDTAILEEVLNCLQLSAINLGAMYYTNFSKFTPFIHHCLSMDVRPILKMATLLVHDIALVQSLSLIDTLLGFVDPVMRLLNLADGDELDLISDALQALTNLASSLKDRSFPFLQSLLNNIIKACLVHVSDDIRMNLKVKDVLGIEEKLINVQKLHRTALESFIILIMSFQQENSSPNCFGLMVQNSADICRAVCVCMMEGMSPIIFPNGLHFESIGQINVMEVDFLNQYPLAMSGINSVEDLVASEILPVETVSCGILVLNKLLFLLKDLDPSCVFSGVTQEFVMLCANLPQDSLLGQKFMKEIKAPGIVIQRFFQETRR
ncbi:putative Importin subunit beta-1 [Blattamonas nauphoetae]|uniref:Importin subunit beta-1 n=1 Tax=Blattamonas nauphoetae TaxID=2049346 RepID=A0ABQ9YG95_9EUKA|nr:putative Importin subunit beta-1 [Blattamonas nauphoetae]